MNEIASKGQLRMSFLRWAIVTVPLIVLLGFVSGAVVATGDDSLWYVALVKPDLTPPAIVFPIAWTTLYILIGLALAMIAAARGSRGRGIAIAAFAAQFAANLAWAPMFFGGHQVVGATLVIVVMLALSILTTVLFARIRTAAAWLMVPYMVWISFAGLLTWGIHRLNPQAESLVPSASTTQIRL